MTDSEESLFRITLDETIEVAEPEVITIPAETEGVPMGMLIGETPIEDHHERMIECVK